MQQSDPLIGQRLGAYHLQEKLGEGGMARVYKAYHARLRRDVAIKVILSHIAENADFKARFEREAQVVANLEHRNIVAVYDFGEIDGLTCLVMQYVGGGTLRDQMRYGQPMDPRRVAHYTLQMAGALHHAHRNGIIHRDVKPQNMLVSSSDPSLLLLSDFGIAKLYDAQHDSTLVPLDTSSHLTHVPGQTSVDQIIGTAEYMAPEQIKQQTLDARTDVYALGAVLYQMLTGCVPFEGSHSTAIMYQHIMNAPMPVRERNPQTPEVLAAITMKALEKSPANRFQSAEEMAQALQFALNTLTGQFSAPLTSASGSSYPYSSPSFSPSSYPASAPYAAPITDKTTPALSPTPSHTPPLQTYTPPRRRTHLVSTLLTVAVVAVALFLVANRFLLPLLQTSSSASGSGNVYTQSYHETFVDNHNNWTDDYAGLQTTIANNQYQLTVNDDNTYFARPGDPGDSGGPLPTNFTYTLTITHTSVDPQARYGLGFRLRDNSTNFAGYVLAIDGQQNYYLYKYDPSSKANGFPQTLASGPLTAIKTETNAQNVLQVIVHDKTFAFKINNKAVPLTNGKGTDYSWTDTSAPFTGGQLGIMVTGKGCQYTVTDARLDL